MSTPYASTEKRAELVRAATQLLHEQGFARTTLADVAALARVPLGNVYYYFKTKEALAEAVIAAHEAALRELFASWAATHRDPRLRLRRLVRAPLNSADTIVRFGCPHGSLCQELEKLEPDAPLAKAAARLLTVYIDWAEEQFVELGFGQRRARAHASDLLAGLQGTMLVAHTMRSQELLAQQLRRVERGIERVISEQQQGRHP
jgi:AcrR family transcriptional regulator